MADTRSLLPLLHPESVALEVGRGEDGWNSPPFRQGRFAISPAEGSHTELFSRRRNGAFLREWARRAAIRAPRPPAERCWPVRECSLKRW